MTTQHKSSKTKKGDVGYVVALHNSSTKSTRSKSGDYRGTPSCTLDWARFEITNVFCDVITRHKYRLCVCHKRACDV